MRCQPVLFRWPSRPLRPGIWTTWAGVLDALGAHEQGVAAYGLPATPRQQGTSFTKRRALATLAVLDEPS
jgi:hypothetical protein